MSRISRWRAAAVAAVFAAGCAESGPVQPDAQYSETVEEAAPDVAGVAVYRNGSPPNGLSTSAWIGAAGGTVRVLDFEVIVPRGAVTTDTRFRIKLPADAKKLNYVMAEFQPHGETFLLPVTLRMPYRGTSAEGQLPSVIWWNGSSWVRLPTTLLPDGRLETMTNHFSFFGVELCVLGLCLPGITPVGG